MSTELEVLKSDSVPAGCFTSAEAMREMSQVAAVISKSPIVPASFKGDEGGVLIALDMAQRLNLNPLAVMQNIYMVGNKPAWTGTFYAALITTSGLFRSYNYEEEETGEEVKSIGRKNLRCRVVAVGVDGNKVCGPWVDYVMAEKDGWSRRNGSKWQTMPELMIRYRAASFFVRTCCPNAAMGLREASEQAEINEIEEEQKRRQPDFVRAIRDRPRAIVETEVFHEAEAIEPEDEGVNYSDAAEVMNQRVEDAPAPDPKAVEGMFELYRRQIATAKTVADLAAVSQYVKDNAGALSTAQYDQLVREGQAKKKSLGKK